MKKMSNEELFKVNGGAFGFLKVLGIGLVALGTFVASVIYGYINPNKCNNWN